MSVPAFLLRALWITPQVMLRFLPVLLIYIGAYVAIVLGTSNPWVLGLLLFIMGTIGLGALLVQGLRAALASLKLTTAAVGDELWNATLRMVFIFGLLSLLLLIVYTLGLYYLFYHVVLPALDPEAYATLQLYFEGGAEAEDAATLSDTLNRLALAGSVGVVAFNFLLALGLGLIMAVFGVPMAALAANAVQHSPRHDLIYGLGKYVPHQVLLYLLFVSLPSSLFSWLPLQILIGSGGSATGAVAAVGLVFVWMLFTLCLPWSGMALAYGLVRERVRAERRAERVPVFDQEAERERLRALRQTRREEGQGKAVYDPNAARRGTRRPQG